jgi:aspartate-semialdehyde dehydrogenase
LFDRTGETVRAGYCPFSRPDRGGARYPAKFASRSRGAQKERTGQRPILRADRIDALSIRSLEIVFEQVAVVGATGAVGRIMLQMLAERNFPARNYKFLASARSAGRSLPFLGKTYTIEELSPSAFDGCDLVIASTPDDVAAKYLPYAVAAGATVIDESGYWRMKPEVALVIPEVNPEAALSAKGIIASPNCSTTQMVVALKPLHDAAGLKRVIVSSYQAVSGAGLQGTVDLVEGSKAHLAGNDYAYAVFSHPIAFNAIPQIGSFKDDGYTSEELKMVHETRKIMGLPDLLVCPTCVRVPIANCHSETITIETERPISPEEARELFAAFPGIVVVDDPAAGRYPMPSDCTGRDEVFVGRIRRDLSNPGGLSFWCVSDNLRKGAATNAVQIAELLAQHRFAPARV